MEGRGEGMRGGGEAKGPTFRREGEEGREERGRKGKRESEERGEEGIAMVPPTTDSFRAYEVLSRRIGKGVVIVAIFKKGMKLLN